MQKRYIVEGNLKHDTMVLTSGDVVVMDEAQAAPLLAIGRLKEMNEAAPAAPVQTQPDGFPDHNLDNKEPENPPANEPDAPAAESQNTPPASESQPNEGNSEQVSPQQNAPANPTNPTPEQIAQELDQIK